MKKLYLLFVLSFIFPAVFTACSDDDENPPLDTENFVIYSPSYTDWIYFSFKDGDVVTVTDPENDLNWDMAVHRYDIRLNGGTSGSGQAAAYDTGKKSLAVVETAPESGYTVDAAMQINYAGMPPLYVEDSANEVASKWINVDTSNMPPDYTLSKNVYVLKTADGKYVKILFTDYMNERTEKPYVTFSYVYQPNGSRTF